jgi:hypothetical protein
VLKKSDSELGLHHLRTCCCWFRQVFAPISWNSLSHGRQVPAVPRQKTPAQPPQTPCPWTKTDDTGPECSLHPARTLRYLGGYRRGLPPVPSRCCLFAITTYSHRVAQIKSCRLWWEADSQSTIGAVCPSQDGAADAQTKARHEPEQVISATCPTYSRFSSSTSLSS